MSGVKSYLVAAVNGTYAFDDVQVTAEDQSTTTYTYDTANQLTAMNVNGTTTNFSYDDWGRMAGKTQGSYAATYDYRFGDKLKAVTSSFPGEAASVGYNYDGLGKRRVEQLGTSSITWFRWLGMEESGEYTGTPGTWTIGAMQTGYVPGLATFAGANPTTAEWRYPLTDHLGSVRQLTAQNKAALARYDYASYGELMRSSGLPLTVGYTGHRWDPAIGQYFAPFRYYNPQTARWNMRDPLDFVDGPNVYAYVAGNPTNGRDVLGLNRTICLGQGEVSIPGHMWLQVDTWDDAGHNTGTVILNFDPQHWLNPEASDLMMFFPPNDGRYIPWFTIPISSTPEQDRELIDEFLRLQRERPEWNVLRSCWTMTAHLSTLGMHYPEPNGLNSEACIMGMY